MREHPVRPLRVAVDCSVFAHAHGGLASFFRPFLLRMIRDYQRVHFFLAVPQSASTAFLPQTGNVSLLLYDNTKPLCFGVGRSLRHPLALGAALRKAQADMLLSPYYSFFIPFLYRHASVITVHDTCFWDMPHLFPGKDRLLHKAFMVWNSLWAQKILTVSETSKRRLLRNFSRLSPEKISVVYNAWEDSPPSAVEAPAPGSRLEYSLRHAPEHLFLCSGGFSAVKNVLTILKALKLALADRDDLGLVLTGNARYVPEAWRMIDALNLHAHVFPTGVLSDAEMAWLTAERATAGICMSEYEGFGRSLVEAMRVGLPLICSDMPTNREIAGEYPDVYCGVHDPTTLCRAMLNVVETGKRPPVFAERFSFSRNWNIFSDILNAVMRSASSKRRGA